MAKELGVEPESQRRDGYDAADGFQIFFDFALGVPDGTDLLQVVFCPYKGMEPMSDAVTNLEPMPCEDDVNVDGESLMYERHVL